MVEHLVWFKLKEEVNETHKQEMLEGLRRLTGKIEGRRAPGVWRGL